MKYSNLYHATATEYTDSSIHINLYELLKPKLFIPKTTTLHSGYSLEIPIYKHEDNYINRLLFYQKVSHYTLRCRMHTYIIKIDKKPDNLNTFLQDYLPLIIKYHITPSYSYSTVRYKGTPTPVTLEVAKNIFIHDTNAFFQSMNIPRPS